jgi:predicted PP-loop superfamily ATPase
VNNLNGEEFKRLVAICGKQASVARSLGVDADTIRARCRDAVVPSLYENAIIGLVLREKLPQLGEIAKLAGSPSFVDDLKS